MQVEAAPLTHTRIAKFYVPLAMSWVFMALESPICTSVVSRLPKPDSPQAILNTAAFQILMAIALFNESTIIDLLSTSTTLSKNHNDFALLSKFVWFLVAFTACLHAFMVLTPFYWVVTRDIMGVPYAVAKTARLGLALMIPWAPSIAWRRYRQGLLIRFHKTRMVGFGTAVRVSTVTTVNLILFLTTHLPAIQIVGTALICSVFSEAMFAHFASRSVVREHLSQTSKPENAPTATDLVSEPIEASESYSVVGNLEVQEDNSQHPLTLAKLVAFHMPLSMTTMVTLIVSPLVSTFLSKSPHPVLSLAAWQVAFSLLWLFRTITFALPEVVITLQKNEQTARKLLDFAIRIGAGTSVVALVVAATRLDVWFFTHVFESTQSAAEYAHLAFFAAAPLGLINAMQSYVRGMLTAHHMNVSRFAAIIVGLFTLVIALWIGLYSPWHGVLSCALALNVSLVAELAVLVWFWRARLRLSLQAV